MGALSTRATMLLRRLPLVLAFGLFLVAAHAAGTLASEDERAQQLIKSPAYKAAVAAFDRDFERFVADLIALVEIPAPPFKEQLRAEAYAKLLREVGLQNVEIDAEGNALGLWRGTGGAPLLAVAAHLDTVFPEGTDVKVKRSGTR